MGKVGFGIIGTGMIARFHLSAIKALKGAEIVAVYDSSKAALSRYCKETGVKGYDDFEAFLSDKDIQVITIATPSGTHDKLAIEAMKHGKNVITEKPMAITVEKCDSMIACAKENNVILSGVFQSRYHEVPNIVKKAVDDGRFGKITLCSAFVKWFRSQEYFDSSSWKGTWTMDGGGALMNQSIHAIDLLQWIAGPICEVMAYTGNLAHQRIEVEDTAVAVVKFASGALGTIEGATSVYPGFFKKIEICGSNGSAVIEEENLNYWKFSDSTEKDEALLKKYSNVTTTGGGAADPKAIDFSGHQKCFQNVVDAIVDNAPVLITGMEASKSVRVIEAIYKSSETHTSVKVEY